MMKESHSNSQTAYTHNLSPDIQVSPDADFGWCHQINSMLKDGYSFLPSSYSDDGFLFRGMRNGLTQAIELDSFWHYDDDRTVTNLEQDLDVMFVSQDFSDAYGVSRLWEGEDDAGILLIKAGHFGRQLDVRQAAMLAFAEPGVVFNYPFLCLPLLLDDIAGIVVGSRAQAERVSGQLEAKGQKMILVMYPESVDESLPPRTATENALMECLSLHHLRGATQISSSLLPKRIIKSS